MSENKVCAKDSCWSVGTIYDPRGLPGVGLRVDEMLQGDCYILAPGDGDILAQGLIELIEYSDQQGASSFLEACLKRTSGLSVLGPEQSWDG
jgi:hypothetical protein